jgi:dihydroflavonol-4-reductase
MTTLVTGAAGFVGWHVTRLLAERLANVRVLLRPGSSLETGNALNIERVYGDLRDSTSLKTALNGVSRVFHIAADYRLWAKDPSEIYENNVQGTRNLIRASRDAGVQKFVYTSSVATIVAHTRQDSLPDERTHPSLGQMIGHYKKSKFMAEQEVMEAAAGGFPAVVVNPTTPVGPRDWKPTPTGRIIVDFLNGKMPAYVDTGFNVVAVEDVAEGHWLAATEGRVGERYILGARNMTLQQFLRVVAASSGRTAPRIRLPYTVALLAGHAENLVSSVTGREPRIPLEGVRMSKHKMFVDCSRASRELGFRPTAVEDAIDRAVGWYLENGYARPSGQSLPAGKGASSSKRPTGFAATGTDGRAKVDS